MRKTILSSIIFLMFCITCYAQNSNTKIDKQSLKQKEQTSKQAKAESDCHGAPCFKCPGAGCNNFSEMHTKILSKLNVSSKKAFLESFEKLSASEMKILMDDLIQINSSKTNIEKKDVGKRMGFIGNSGNVGITFADLNAICCRRTAGDCCKAAPKN